MAKFNMITAEEHAAKIEAMETEAELIDAVKEIRREILQHVRDRLTPDSRLKNMPGYAVRETCAAIIDEELAKI